jgi:hypothetical protein
VEDLKTNSNTGLGTRSQVDRLARTGNKAPLIEVASIMKTEATLIPKDLSDPPPEPQSIPSMVDIAVSVGEVDKMVNI